MSYSRWSNSSWYTYHSVASGITKETQVLQINHVNDFSIPLYYPEAKAILSNPHDLAEIFPSITNQELTELTRYITWFVDDINEEFKE